MFEVGEILVGIEVVFAFAIFLLSIRAHGRSLESAKLSAISLSTTKESCSR
jgi:hypothetical protein